MPDWESSTCLPTVPDQKSSSTSTGQSSSCFKLTRKSPSSHKTSSRGRQAAHPSSSSKAIACSSSPALASSPPSRSSGKHKVSVSSSSSNCSSTSSSASSVTGLGLGPINTPVKSVSSGMQIFSEKLQNVFGGQSSTSGLRTSPNNNSSSASSALFEKLRGEPNRSKKGKHFASSKHSDFCETASQPSPFSKSIGPLSTGGPPSSTAVYVDPARRKEPGTLSVMVARNPNIGAASAVGATAASTASPFHPVCSSSAPVPSHISEDDWHTYGLEDSTSSSTASLLKPFTSALESDNAVSERRLFRSLTTSVNSNSNQWVVSPNSPEGQQQQQPRPSDKPTSTTSDNKNRDTNASMRVSSSPSSPPLLLDTNSSSSTSSSSNQGNSVADTRESENTFPFMNT